MNNHESDQDDYNEKEPQIDIKLDDSVIKVPLSTFNNIIQCAVTKYILKIQNNNNIIGLNNLADNERWKKTYEYFKTQANNLNLAEKRLKRDLKINAFAQPNRCYYGHVEQNVEVNM